MSALLFNESGEESDVDVELHRNETYARSYNKRKQMELLQKSNKDGNVESDSSSSTESSDEGEVLDTAFDEEFFRTLAMLKKKDPVIYNKETKFFVEIANDGVKENETAKQECNSKAITLNEYNRKILEDHGGVVPEDDDDKRRAMHTGSPTPIEEDKHLRNEFKRILHDDDNSENEEFGGIFRKRTKTAEESKKEEDDYRRWLLGQEEKDILDDVKQVLQPLKNYWNSSKLPQGERFLRDYILNKRYDDRESKEIPTYEEIVGDKDKLSEDENDLEEQDQFEHHYNFRFEEPNAEFIARYPRTIANSVRRPDNSRKEKRNLLKERKQQEKEQKMKELEIIKDLKRREIQEKIEKLKMVTGNEELGFKAAELEEDFDPEAHDRRMQEVFNDEYYQVDEGDEKPQCPLDIEELEFDDWDDYDSRREGGEQYNDYEPHCEDEDFNMDCEYDPNVAKRQQLPDNSKATHRNRRGRKKQFAGVIEAPKPVFNPDDEKTYAEYLDEYYKMDCEDFIDDIPCRFKYVETEPNDFGLTIEEILMAKNKELNQWASLKKTIQIRPEKLEKKERQIYKLKSRNFALKRKIFKSLYGDSDDEKDDINEDKTFNSTVQTSEVKCSDAEERPEGTNKLIGNKLKRKVTTIEGADNFSKDAKRNAQELQSQRQNLHVNRSSAKALKRDSALIEDATEAGSTASENNNRKKRKKENVKQECGKKQDHETILPKSELNEEKRDAKRYVWPPNDVDVVDAGPYKCNTVADKLNTASNKKSGDIFRGPKASMRDKREIAGQARGKEHKKKKTPSNVTGSLKISDRRVQAYDINPKKLRKLQNYHQNQRNKKC